MFTSEQILNDRQALERLVREHRILKEAVQNSPVNFCVYDHDDCLIAWNNAYEALHSEAFSENRAKAESGKLTYREIIRYEIAKTYPEDQVEKEVEQRVADQRDATGQFVVRRYPTRGYVRVCKYPLPSGARGGMAFEINDLKATQEQLEQANDDIRQQALTDALTGVRNRRYVDEHLPDIISKASEVGARVALLHIDLDRFKPINDIIGHAAGDHVLQNTATVLTEICPECDFIARVGGDEFVIALSGSCEEDAVRRTAEHIIARLAQPEHYDDQICRIGASIGIAVAPASEIDYGTLMVHADIALHQAKKEGRNCCRFFNTELKNRLRWKKTIADEIIAGIEQRRFFPVFQPQFVADTLELRGIETLCRWRHPDRGILMPEVFMEIAKDMELISAIDRLLMEETITQIRRVQASGLDIPKIAFNVGNRRLLDPSLVRQLADLQGLDIEVAVELVESMSLDNLDQSSIWSIDTLKERGVSVEIDDFGSSHASIAGLMSVGPKTMKIDQRIILPIVNSEPHRKLVRAIIEIGNALDIEIIAEGVETEQHVRLLKHFGCDVVQGFALAYPMPIEGLVPFLTKRQRGQRSNPRVPAPSSSNYLASKESGGVG